MKRSRKKALIITAIVLALPVLFLVEEHFRGKWALAKLKREMAAKGEKLTVEECRPPLPLDGADNAYPALMRAIAVFPGGQASQVTPGSMRAVGPDKVRTVFSLSEWFDTYTSDRNPRKTNTWETLADALAPGAEQLPAIRELLRKPVCVSTHNYHRGFDAPMPHLAKTRMMAQELSADALLRLHQGQNDEAVEDIISALQLADALREERLVISQLVRIANTAIAVGPTWQALQAPGLTDGQLARLHNAWQSRQFVPEMLRSLEMERAVASTQYDRYRASPGSMADALESWALFDPLGGAGTVTTGATSFDDVVQTVGDKAGKLFRRGVAVPVWQFAWSYEDERAYLAVIQAMLDGGRKSYQSYSMQTFFRARDALERQVNGQWAYDRIRHLISSMLATSLSRTIDRAIVAEAQRDLILAAVALKRFELRHGRLPAELGALVPEFLPAPPRDIFDGQPLRYRLREDGGFLLYSVGKDEKDDGGDAKSSSGKIYYMGNGRDLVWPMPASAAEVEAADKKTNGAARAAPSVNK